MALKDRPDDEIGGAQWDLVLADSYRKDTDGSKALQHTYKLLVRARKSLMAELIAGEDVGGMNRKAIFIIDNLLKTPDLVDRQGREAERFLREVDGRNG